MSVHVSTKSAMAFVFVVVLIDSIGFGIILPVLPQLIMQLTGVTVDRAAVYGGGLSFVYALMQFFCAPVLGNLSDQFGRRPVLLFALLALGCDYLIMGFAPTIALAVRRPHDRRLSPAPPSRPPMPTWPTSPSRRSARRASACMGAAFGIGFIVGPGDRRAARHSRAARAVLHRRRPSRSPTAPSATSRCRSRCRASRGAPSTGCAPTRSARSGRCAATRSWAWLLLALFLWQLGHQVLPSTWAFYTITKFHWSSRPGRLVAHLRRAA